MKMKTKMSSHLSEIIYIYIDYISSKFQENPSYRTTSIILPTKTQSDQSNPNRFYLMNYITSAGCQMAIQRHLAWGQNPLKKSVWWLGGGWVRAIIYGKAIIFATYLIQEEHELIKTSWWNVPFLSYHPDSEKFNYGNTVFCFSP